MLNSIFFLQDTTDSFSTITLKRTSTGILSNRRPVSGTPANSGTTTPGSETPRLSLLANAKREAAKHGLYSNFLRGPILGPDEGIVSNPSCRESSNVLSATIDIRVDLKGKKLRKLEDAVDGEKERKRRKRELKAGRTERKGRNEHEVIEASESEITTSKQERRKGRRREREAKRQARMAEKVQKRNVIQDEEEDETERRHKQEEQKGKGKTSPEDTRDDSLNCILPDVDAGDEPRAGRGDMPIQLGDISRGATRKKKRKRWETSDS